METHLPLWGLPREVGVCLSSWAWCLGLPGLSLMLDPMPVSLCVVLALSLVVEEWTPTLPRLSLVPSSSEELAGCPAGCQQENKEAHCYTDCIYIYF